MSETPKLYATYHPDGDGFVRHATLEEANKSAEESIDAENDHQSGWGDFVDSICVLKVISIATQCELREPDEDGNDPETGEPWASEFDSYCDYKLVDVPDPLVEGMKAQIADYEGRIRQLGERNENQGRIIADHLQTLESLGQELTAVRTQVALKERVVGNLRKRVEKLEALEDFSGQHVRELAEEMQAEGEAKIEELTATVSRLSALIHPDFGPCAEVGGKCLECDRAFYRIKKAMDFVIKMNSLGHECGWNGVENSKILEIFFENLIGQLTADRQAAIDSLSSAKLQNEALRLEVDHLQREKIGMQERIDRQEVEIRDLKAKLAEESAPLDMSWPKADDPRYLDPAHYDHNRALNLTNPCPAPEGYTVHQVGEVPDPEC